MWKYYIAKAAYNMGGRRLVEGALSATTGDYNKKTILGLLDSVFKKEKKGNGL